MVQNRNMKREFWVKEKKIAFITLPGKGGHSKQNALKNVPSIGKN